jgi:hypothetical protein
MNLYTAAKWRTARLTKFDYRKTLAVAMALAIGSDFLHYVSFARWMGPATQRELEGLFLLLATAPLIPMLWSRFHISRYRVSLQLYVEHNELVSFHWTPRPEWIASLGGRFLKNLGLDRPSVPRRAALAQLREWIPIAQSYGYRELRLESPLFVTRGEDGHVVQRGWLRRFVDPLEQMKEVACVEYLDPTPLSKGRAVSFQLFWPGAARRTCRTPDGRILAGGIVIHLTPAVDRL